MRTRFEQYERFRLPVEHAKRDSAAAAPRPGWRTAVAAGLVYSGAIRLLQIAGRFCEITRESPDGPSRLRKADHPKFAVLCYHRIGTGGIPLFSELPAKSFEAQMRYIRRRYRVLSLDQLCEEMQRPRQRADAVAVTFDDGYRDLYTQALPVLKKYQIPATIFLPIVPIETGEVPWYDKIFLGLRVFPEHRLEITLEVSRIFQLSSHKARIDAAAEIIAYLRTIPDDQRKMHCSALEKRFHPPADQLANRMLTWEQIRAMGREGIDFGSHTMTHPAVSQLNETDLKLELGESKRILEQRIGKDVAHFAYPFGKPADCGLVARAILERTGYRSAGTTTEGINQAGDDCYELRRTQIGNERSPAMFIFKLNQLFFNCRKSSPCAENSAITEPLTEPERPPVVVKSA
jgi:peptidoglycan/xylan/chitin deacetylase (PgdA/CDA1 family)